MFVRAVCLRACLIAAASVMAAACSKTGAPDAAGDDGGQIVEPGPDAGSGAHANVVAVSTSGSAGAYRFVVTVESPDTGCDRYADWWEVITPDGALLYRRILTHSHVNEQPFTRGGGPIEVQSGTQVIVRGHMNDAGYGGVAFSGSVEAGFSADPSVSAGLAPELAEEPPLPSGCAF